MKTSLRERRSAIDPVQKRQKTIDEIKKDYADHGKYRVTPADQRNIMLLGRTRTGKSTIKSLLVDPTVVPDDMTLKSGTKDPLFESFHVRDNQIVLNIIDTPGLFEHSNNQVDIRDNETILRTIKICANREITKFHVICFCVAITAGINEQDIQSLKLLVDFLGKGISRNSCLIITRCESKTDKQRATMQSELLEDSYFKEIASFFQLGIFFSGSIDPDDYTQGNDSIVDQFLTVSEYRTKLIETFTSNIEPFPITETLLSQIKKVQDEAALKEAELDSLRITADEQERLIKELKEARAGDQKEMQEMLDKMLAMNIHQREERARRPRRPDCSQS